MSRPSRLCVGYVALLVVFAAGPPLNLAGQHSGTDLESPASEAEPEGDAAEASAGGDAQRTDINLLGETASESGESRRNENVQFNLVDNNALKELNIRLGTTATLVDEFDVDLGYFGSEYGKPPAPSVHVPPERISDFHGDASWRHNNSVFSARSFFQVGAVRPARENLYSVNLAAPLGPFGAITLGVSQNKIRGNVNGNVLIPLPEERAPLAKDPATRAAVQELLDAYPNVPPNRPDIADRAHNTNSLQRISTDSSRVQLDRDGVAGGKLSVRHVWTAQNVDAFQLVRGQNPDTDNRSHSARLTWSRAFAPATVLQLSTGLDRLGTLLLPAEGAVGPIFMTSRDLTTLGPYPNIPIDRAQNRWRQAVTLRHTRGKHELTAGFALTRLQYNGEEPDASRGILLFAAIFGNDAITNLRLGQPNRLVVSLGSTYRGFRNWSNKFFLGDRWQATSRLTLHLGVRYEPFTRPGDVTGRTELGMDSDLNNFAGSFGFAYRLPGDAGRLRGNFASHYGDLFPVTYGQARLNPPHTVTSVIIRPSLANWRSLIDHSKRDPNARSSRIEPGPDLTVPYEFQYNFSWEKRLAADWRLQLGYVGSRAHKLIITYFLNRAREVPGVVSTIGNLNERRPDQSIFEHLFIHNGSRGYFDAGRVTLTAPNWRGLSLNASYWLSKAIDLGGSYTNTASGPDARLAIAQTEQESHRDLKGLSDFDQPHAFLLQAGYAVPRGLAPGWAGKLLGNWTLSTVTLVKSGTPFTVRAGSDGPGFGNIDGRLGDRPTVVDSSVLGRVIGSPDTSESLLPRSAFRFMNAPAEQAGSLGRNTFRKGKIANVNASLSRRFPIRSEWSMELRAETINLLNTPQFAEPGMSLTSPNFGQINNTLNDGRTFRFQLKLLW
ncbi:MAG: TonB-dependent receptor [Bryobacterales bacterium]|nr:TonB-dependent receptor [Bryobacterales bacterium]